MSKEEREIAVLIRVYKNGEAEILSGKELQKFFDWLTSIAILAWSHGHEGSDIEWKKLRWVKWQE